jgi:predicted ArsR family transcriptional regulator
MDGFDLYAPACPISQARVLRLLSQIGPMTARELAVAIPASLRTVLRALDALHSTHAVFIDDYRPNWHGRAAKIWAPGADDDAIAPLPRASAERKRAMRRRMSAEERDFARARRRALDRLPRRDKLTAALFGRVSSLTMRS